MRGVFLVAAELAQRSFIVSPTSRSARGVDLLATNLEGSRTFAVEVKSASNSTFWIVGQKAGEWVSRNNIFVFVKLSKDRERSRFFVVPSTSIRKLIIRGTTFTFVRRKDIARYEDRWSAFGRAE